MHQQLARKALGPVAVAAIAFAVVLEAVGVYGDRSGTRTRPGSSSWSW